MFDFAKICALFILLGLASVPVQAQFSFIYTGPDSLYVGDDCTAILDWGHPETPTAHPTMPGQIVISFEIYSISGGYAPGDPVPGGALVTVFYEARDNMGHITLFGFNLFVRDTIPPVFDPQSLPDDITINCGEEIVEPFIEYDDNCASDSTFTELTFEEQGAADLCDGGVIMRIWTVTDESANTTQYIQNITVNPDTTAPVITGMPVDGTAECGDDAMAAYSAWIDTQRAAFEAVDDGCGVMAISDNAPPPSVVQGFCGEISVDFVAADSCDNTSSASATFSVTNTVPPTISVPASDGMTACDQGDPVNAFQQWLDSHGGAEAFDDCSFITWSTNPESPTLADTCNGTITVEFIADDGCGNIVGTTAQFLVQDTVPPQITAVAQNRVVNCNSQDYVTELGTWISNAAMTAASDLCTPGDALQMIMQINGVEVDSADIQDALQDSILTGCVDGVIIDGLLWNDVLGMIEVEFVYFDACGNSASATGVFAIRDPAGPSFVNPPQDQIITCGGGDIDSLFSLWFQTAANAAAEDGCGSVLFFGLPDEQTAYDMLQAALDTACEAGAYVDVAFYLSDLCGNPSADTLSATFGVFDSLGPVLEQPAQDFEFLCEGSSTDALRMWLDTVGGASASDLCGSIQWTFHWQDNTGDTLSGNPGTGPYPQISGLDCQTTLPVMFVAADICGNTVATEAQFAFTDTISPVIETSADTLVVSCEDTVGMNSATATDNCTSQPLLTFTDTEVVTGDTSACGDITGTFLRTWTAMDDCGNQTTQTQIIEIADLTAPVFNPPSDTTLSCFGDLSPEMTGTPTGVNDNCDQAPSVTFADAITGTGCDITVTRSWVVADACGNSSSATQIIVLIDTLPPELATIPSDLVVGCDTVADIMGAFNSWLQTGGGIQFDDVCGSAEYFVAGPGSYVAGDTSTYPGTPPVLDIPEECVASPDGIIVEVQADVFYFDPCGNFDVHAVQFSLVDNSPPLIQACPEDLNQIIDPETCSATFSLTPPLVVEGCFAQRDTVTAEHTIPVESDDPGSDTIPVNALQFVFDNVPVPPAVPSGNGILEITLNGVDADGVSEYFNVYGEGNFLIGQTQQLLSECDTGESMLTLSAAHISEWSDDGMIGLTLEPFVADPDSGHLAINDICPGATVTVRLSYQSLTPSRLQYAYRVDNGAPVVLDSFEQFQLLLSAGVHTVTHYVADCAGNVDSCSTQLFAQDTVPPVVACPGDITLATESGCEMTIDLSAPQVIENCETDTTPVVAQYKVSGATTIDLSPFPAEVGSISEVFLVGESMVVYLVEDNSGNIDSCVFHVTITDAVVPEAGCMDTVIYVHPAGDIPFEMTPDLVDNGSVDNCGIDEMLVQPVLFPCDSAGTVQTVELVVADASGNRDTCTASVQVEVQPLVPAYAAGFCPMDTLRLFSNAPPAAGDPYTFNWTGPNGFGSDLANPVIPDATSAASGVYSVTVTGVNDCTTTGVVEVVVEDFIAPDISVDANIFCDGQSVVLQASEFDEDVTYQWYRGMAPNGILLGSTEDPTFTDTPPAIGDYSYYVVVANENCETDPSENVIISVVTAPEATVNDLFVEVCEGGEITLGTEVTGGGITYAWTGPDGFSSDMQNPSPITDAQLAHAGNYTLVVYLGACSSDPATTVVVVNASPEQPQISGDTLYCVGEEALLTAGNVVDADQYVWMGPGGVSIPTTTNSLSRTIDPSDAGVWSVTAYYGDCASDESAPFHISVESELELDASNTGPVCSDDSVRLQVQVIPGSTYMWEGPQGFTSDEAMPFVSTPTPGVYTVTVTSANGCTSTTSTEVEVGMPPEISALSNTAGSCADGTQDLSFAVTLFPDDDGSYSYQWTGPDNFMSTDSSPVITGLTSAHNGVYYLTVFNGTCASMTDSTVVDVTDSPGQPSIDGQISVCAGEDLVLQVQDYPADSVLYTWTTPTGVVNIWNDSTLRIDAVQTASAGSYSVVVSIDGCPSVASVPFDVSVIPEPAQPEISGDAAVCAGDTLHLFAEFNGSADFEWTGPGGFTSQDRNPYIYPATEDATGSYQVTAYVGECASPVSAPFTVEVLELPQTPQISTGMQSVCLDDPRPFTLCIDSTSATTGAMYNWLTSDGVPVASNVTTRCVQIDDVSAFGSGINLIVAEAVINGCRSGMTDLPVTILGEEYPEEVAEAGDDVRYCRDQPVQLDATPGTEGTGYWSSPDPQVVIADPANPKSPVTNLKPGENVLVWTLDADPCFAFSRDTVVIIVEADPVAVDDSVFVDFGITTNFDVVFNDTLPDTYTLDVISQPARGNLLQQSSGLFVYTPNIGFVGPDAFTYEICSGTCPEQCRQAIVILQVGDENDCFVPSIFTPNDDGVNDRFIIPCLETERFPQNRVIVFNQWGDVVFEAQPYSNDWDGMRKGKDLPVSTYYYVVDFGDGSEVRKGFLIIER